MIREIEIKEYEQALEWVNQFSYVDNDPRSKVVDLIREELKMRISYYQELEKLLIFRDDRTPNTCTDTTT